MEKESITGFKGELLGALIGLSRAANGMIITDKTADVIINALNCLADSNSEALIREKENVRAEKFRLSPDCATCMSPCGRTSDYDCKNIINANKNIKELKTEILGNIEKIAVNLKNNAAFKNGEFCSFLSETLFILGEDFSEAALKEQMLKTEEMLKKCS